MSVDIEEKIFEQGFTTTDGSGLGLYHVGQLVAEMNGEVRYSPTAEKGAKFTIKLKLVILIILLIIY